MERHNIKNTELRNLQLCELEILKEFANYCENRNLKYALVGGTLLGAIRHNGFIPWDDDIDVAMPREDYDRFIGLTKRENISDDLFVESGDLDNDFSLPITKLMHKKYAISFDNMTHENQGNSIWIDIMPIDGVGSDYEVSKKIMREATHLQKCLGRASSIPWKLRPDEHGFLGYLRCLYRQLYRLRGYEYYKQKLIQLGKSNDFNSSDYVAIVVFGLYGYGEIVSRSRLIEYQDVMFEGLKFKTIGCWKEYLSGIYGDYMKLPPEEKRVSPHRLKVIVRNG